MRIPQRLLTLAAVLAAGVTCSFPTDESDRVFVTVVSLDTSIVVRRGGQLELYAHMYHAAGADTAEIQNVRFLWTTDDASIATVDAGGFGSATVTGVNSGVVNITARAVAFEQARTAQFAVRVSDPVEVDSVRPSLVRYGDTIKVFGVGVDSVFFVSLAGATLFDYPIPGLLPTRTRDSLGFSTATFWVTPPARTDSLFFLGNGVFGFAQDTTRVLPFDIYEPNETLPWQLSLDTPRFPQLPFVLFFNPALAFEPTKRDVLGADWYRFTQSTTRDLTIIINSADVRGAFDTYVSDSLYWDGTDSTYYVGLDSWTVGPQLYVCHGRGFSPAQVRPESTIVALRAVPLAQDTLHALSVYAEPGRYGVTVVEGYVTSDTRYPRDGREEDDYCSAADARTPYPGSGVGFQDTLTIDNPFDVDWIRFRVPSLSTVRFRVASLVPGDTLSDIDLYVLSDTAAGLVELGSGQRAGSTEDFSLALTAGEYYAVVVDFAGVPTRYAVCFAVSTAAVPCNGLAGFPAPALAPGVEPRRKAAPGRAPAVRPARRGAP